MINAILAKSGYTAGPEHTTSIPGDAPADLAGIEAAITAVKESKLPTPATMQQHTVSSTKDIEKALASLNKNEQLSQRGIVFAQDKDTGIDVIKVIDSRTNKVLLQIPSQDMVEVAKRLDDVRGILFRKSA